MDSRHRAPSYWEAVLLVRTSPGRPVSRTTCAPRWEACSCWIPSRPTRTETRPRTPGTSRSGPHGRSARLAATPACAVLIVGAGRFELPTSRTRTVRATKLRYAPSPYWRARENVTGRGLCQAQPAPATGSRSRRALEAGGATPPKAVSARRAPSFRPATTGRLGGRCQTATPTYSWEAGGHGHGVASSASVRASVPGSVE
jgi:hypothetical protein